jgi:hypothetical protein
VVLGIFIRVKLRYTALVLPTFFNDSFLAISVALYNVIVSLESNNIIFIRIVRIVFVEKGVIVTFALKLRFGTNVITDILPVIKSKLLDT